MTKTNVPEYYLNTFDIIDTTAEHAIIIHNYITSDEFKKLTKYQRKLIKKQLKAILKYQGVLVGIASIILD